MRQVLRRARYELDAGGGLGQHGHREGRADGKDPDGVASIGSTSSAILAWWTFQKHDMLNSTMRQVPLERDINIAVNGCSGFATSTQKGPFKAMLISRSRGTYLIPKYHLLK